MKYELYLCYLCWSIGLFLKHAEGEAKSHHQVEKVAPPTKQKCKCKYKNGKREYRGAIAIVREPRCLSPQGNGNCDEGMIYESRIVRARKGVKKWEC